MSTYTQFEDEFLVAAYELVEESGDETIPVRRIVEAFAFEPKPNWIGRALKGLIDYGYSEDYRHIGPDLEQDVHLTPHGVRNAERLVQEGVRPPRRGNAPELPPGVSDIAGGRILAGPTGSMENIAPREGDILLEYPNDDREADLASVRIRDEVEAELVPASDRLVPLDHDSAPYQQVKQGLTDLHEELRSANDLECSPDERERLLTSLSAAQKLWESAQLKIIQIKVGIIITIEDTINLLAKSGKAVGKSVLIDVVKAIVRHATGVHL